jgi:hypothetical protein
MLLAIYVVCSVVFDVDDETLHRNYKICSLS